MITLKLPKHIEQPDPGIYKSNNYLVLDFETEGFPLDKTAQLLLSGWKLNGQPYQYFWGSEYELAVLHTALDRADFIVCHNAKFELQWLLRSGYDIASLVVFDTMLAERVILGNRRGDLSLDGVGEKYVNQRKGSVVSLLIQGGTPVRHIPKRWLLEYNQQDVELTESVFLKQREIIQDSGLGPVLFTRCLTTIPLADIELRGMQLDADRVICKWTEISEKYHESKQELDQITGGINLNSPKQVSEFLYDKLGFAEIVDFRGNVSKTESGGRRTDEECISSLKARSDAQQQFKSAFLAYRKLALAHRNLQKLRECIENDQGTLYAQLNQHVTQTHRLSSTGGKYKLQFQNFDRTWKPLFRARREGWSIGEVDGRQLEFRVAVHLGQDKQGLEDVRNDFDVHRRTASILLRKKPEKVTKDERTAAKPETFKPLYGGQSGSPAQRRYYAAFRERYSQIFHTQTGWTYDVLRSGKLRVASGLIFYWPGTKQSRSGYIENTTSIFNYPVQSLATAEIIPISVFYLWHLMRANGMQSYLINTIHDSAIAEIAPGEGDLWVELCKEAFTTHVFKYLEKVYEIKFICPLGIEAKIGEHWGEGEETKYDLDPV